MATCYSPRLTASRSVVVMIPTPLSNHPPPHSPVQTTTTIITTTERLAVSHGHTRHSLSVGASERGVQPISAQLLNPPRRQQEYRLSEQENNATLLCFPNGTWSSKSSYTHCLNLVSGPSLDQAKTNYTTKIIFYFGHSLSLVAVTIALCIFLSFKDLRCLRNSIHANLLSTYLLHNLFWIVYASVQTLLPVNVVCSFVVPINYFSLTSFMWMAVEGEYA
ncbi:diuretic hormone receptor-like [Portunus trituberculatus]|uniref:diuretic hormone receptor-like n=1 Tax=Portunus trituberculatus TaxID=210409 RepID=UPI001E1D17DE|nr:diuretic hormone receptor-like [Portunus trituberculatus]